MEKYSAVSPIKLALSSCFLLAMKDDSIEGIYDTLKQCALISKSAGGIGVAVSCIRATGSYIAGVSVTFSVYMHVLCDRIVFSKSFLCSLSILLLEFEDLTLVCWPGKPS